MKRFLMALTIAALGLAFSGRAQAFTQTTTSSMNLSATIVAACSITTSPFSFGTSSGNITNNVSSGITVNCSTGTPYRVDFDAGLNSTGTVSMTRNLKTGTAPPNASNTINYIIKKGYTTEEWGDNGTTFCPTCPTPITGQIGTGTGLDVLYGFTGVRFPTTNAPGLYTDTITVTVNY